MISIIIPIYNAEKELDRMLTSIQRQSMTDYEVIMIDDGSRDNSEIICKKFVSRDQRFHYFYQENKGVSVARNNGMSRARGEYIAFVDADDEIDPNYLEVLLEACKHSDIAVCDVVIEKNGKEIGRFTGERDGVTREEAINLLLKRRIINSGPYAKLYRRNVIGKVEFPLMKTYEDILFNLHAFFNANSISITPKTQYHYIENSKGAMSTLNKAVSIDIIVASDQILQFITRKNSMMEPECLYVTLSHVFQYVIALLKEQMQRNTTFLVEAKYLFKKNLFNIWNCSAIPWKEKIVFSCFASGWIYTNKKLISIHKMR